MRRCWPVDWVRVFGCLVFVFGSSCSRETPSLIGVSQVNPSVVEAQDTLTVLGEGFAEGARARVNFTGTLFQSGRPPRVGTRISLSGFAVSRERLSIVVDSAAIAQFCGEQEPVHTTFVGAVSVTFPPKTPGAPLVAGRLAEARLDVYPAPDQLASEFDADAVRGFWGAELSRPTEGEGLVLSHLDPDAVAGKLGLRAGDRVLRYDGLSVRSWADLVPYPGQRQAQLLVQRQQGGMLEVPVTVDGFAPMPAEGWALGASLAASLALLLILSRSPLGRASAWLGFQLFSTRRSAPALRLSSKPVSVPPRAARHFLAFMLASGLFAVLQFQLFRAVADVDLLLLYLLSVLLLALKQLWLGGFGGRGWSLWRALRAALRGVVAHVLLLLCLVPAVTAASSLSLRELVRSQSDALLTLNLLQTPSDYVAGVSLLCLLGMSAMSGADGQEPGGLGRLAGTLAEQLETFRLLLGAGLFVCLYAGGWAWPAALAEPNSLLAQALLFQAKLTVVYLLLQWCRQRLPTVSERYLQSYTARFLLPAAVLAALAAPVWTVEVWPDWLHQSVALTFAWLSCGAVALMSLRLLPRFRGSSATAALNPWL